MQPGPFYGVERKEVGLRFLPRPDFMEFTYPPSHHVIVTNDGSALTTRVVALLEEAGTSVVVVNLPGTGHPLKKNAITLSAHSDEAVKQALNHIHTTHGKTAAFIHLHPHFEFQNGQFSQHFKAEREVIKSLFFFAKHLQKSLNEPDTLERKSFIAVTRMDGMLGFGKRGNVSVTGGGIPGLVKSLNLEWPAVFCRSLDLEPELSIDQMATQVIAELHDADVNLVEVAFSEKGRKTTSVTPVHIPENQSITTRISGNSVFLVSGGARGVTATCVIELAKTFRCKFILLGRSSSGFEIPAYARNGIDEGTLKRLIMDDLKQKGEKPNISKVQQAFKEIVARKEIDNTLAEIIKYGGQAAYLEGDVTRIEEVKHDLEKITASLGPITGIIHGAGRLADKYIQDKTENDFDNVLSVKIDGLLSLLGAVDPNKLRHLILFSSVAGFYGNVGQTDYAIANEILSKAAHLFKTNHPGTHVTAINWGAWDSGMVSGELKAQFEAAGVTLINSKGGAAMLVNELSTAYAGQPQVIIGGTLPAAESYLGGPRTFRIRRLLKLDENPFLMHHVIQENPVLPVVSAVGWMARTCENLYPGFKVLKVENTRLFKGIVFDGRQPEEYTTELKETAKSPEQIEFEVTVVSKGNKLPVVHYKAQITLNHKKLIPEAPRFSHQISDTFRPTPGSALYQDGSLFHGTYFQGIDQILDLTEKQIVMSCIAPEVPLPDQGQFHIQSVNTFFADIQYQGMVVWVQKFMDGAKSLPLKTDRAFVYKEILPGDKLFVNVTIHEASEFSMVANCTVYDSEGAVYMSTLGATVTVSKELVW